MRKPDQPSNAGNLEEVADWGRLFLGYFLLAKQKKVTSCRSATGGFAFDGGLRATRETNLSLRPHRQRPQPALFQLRLVRLLQPSMQVVQHDAGERVYPVVALIEAGDVVVFAAAGM